MRINGNTGNGNPSRASFVGSTGGITITLNFGDYIVTDDVQANASSPLEVVKHFGADCSCSITAVREGKVQRYKRVCGKGVFVFEHVGISRQRQRLV